MQRGAYPPVFSEEKVALNTGGIANAYSIRGVPFCNSHRPWAISDYIWVPAFQATCDQQAGTASRPERHLANESGHSGD